MQLSGTPALMAGSTAPRVYIRCSYGLFNRLGGRLRFRVTDIRRPPWQGGVMDLFYTIEKE